MKSVLCAILTASLVLTFAVCENTAAHAAAASETVTEQTIGGEGSANPMTACDSLEEINEAIHVNLVHPPVAGITDESFAIIQNEIAQYCFTVNGIPYTFRASANYEDDISGVYSGNGLLLDRADADGYAADDSGKIMKWATTEGQYTLYAADAGQLDEETFQGIAEELKTLTVGYNTASQELYAALEGDYQDSVSQRATASVVNNGGSVTITVHWSSSAFEYTEWTMTAKLGETDGLLNYTDCTMVNYTSDSDGRQASTTIEYENGEGFFSVGENNDLIWNGAADENCIGCVFVKAE